MAIGSRLTDGRVFSMKPQSPIQIPANALLTSTKKFRSHAKNFTIHIAISPTKNADRIEWFVEKAVEFGIDEITLLECDHTERQHMKIDRLEKMAISAMKQSLKASSRSFIH